MISQHNNVVSLSCTHNEWVRKEFYWWQYFKNDFAFFGHVSIHLDGLSLRFWSIFNRNFSKPSFFTRCDDWAHAVKWRDMMQYVPINRTLFWEASLHPIVSRSTCIVLKTSIFLTGNRLEIISNRSIIHFHCFFFIVLLIDLLSKRIASNIYIDGDKKVFFPFYCRFFLANLNKIEIEQSMSG